eukprot:CAMPEP_0202455492 /NCGR_PEP_ID=MMETSP1360-20130828/13014_1 /ASSEMBLY_ACC=CAM_ASM_000848 /TAXON_ID=515479 /ORGANISM="Licmophora paradoxa, Strain CCMP2313" /LENGTH=184 /DNA_ID=CAMNT_0049075087 /DNA_START=296 /DNA_END=850 /DNA_ORIENTATION=+
MTRNPYVRFLSSYQDWLRRISIADATNYTISFSEFVEIYKARKFSGRPIKLIDHIDPVTKYCKFQRMRYVVLRIEEQALWFDAFVNKYGMAKQMKEYTEGGNLVFASLLDESKSKVSDFVGAILGIEEWPSKRYESGHNRGSAGKIMQFYTPDIAAEVTALFHDDFVHFQYPLWDGNPGLFRFV